MSYREFTRKWLGWILALVLAAGFVVHREAGSAANMPAGAPGVQQTVPVTPAGGRELLGQFSKAFESAAAKVNPSVVPVFSEQVRSVNDPFASDQNSLRDFFGDEFFKRFFGGAQGDQREVVRGLGSGVIVTADGYILTNNHVIDGADKLTVMLNDKKYPARVIGRDQQTDVAVIKIDARDLPVASLGNSDSVATGEWVIAVGNPFQLMHTVTAGIISAKGRSSVNLADYEDFIQTDASINPGNSGGALADLDGNVIGINTAILSPAGGNVGIGFAVPINMAKSILNQLVAKGKVTRGYLGLVPQDIDEALASALKLKGTAGALVADVSPAGPADKAGIKQGDVILKFNDVALANSVNLRNLVASAVPGSKTHLTIQRDGKPVDVTVELGERPTNLASTSGEGEQEHTGASQKLGLSIQPLTPQIAQQLGYSGEKGVIVEKVAAGSPADEAGLKRGDLIKEVNRKTVHTQQEFWSALGETKNGGSVAFLVRRGETDFFVGMQATS